MRYFLVVRPDDGPAYVVAETVRERFDDGRFRDSSLASQVDLTRAQVVTEAELRHLEGGSEALRRWDQADDSSFDADEAGSQRQTGGHRLSLVPPAGTRGTRPARKATQVRADGSR